MEVGQPHLIRQINQDMIRSLISSHGPITKPELAKLTNLSLPTVNKIVDMLESDQIVCRVENESNGVGRKAQFYQIQKDAMKAIIVFCINGQYHSCLTTLSGEIIDEKKTNIMDEAYKNSLECMQAVIDFYLERYDKSEIHAIVVGISGITKPDGCVVSIPSIPDLEGVNLKRTLEERYELPILMENDVKLMSVGYFYTESNDDFEDMVFLYIGTGIGSGTILNKKMMSGYRHFAGELGYMTLSESDQDQKPIGAVGNLERRILPMVEKLEKDPKMDNELIYHYHKTIARVIANFVSIINPEVVVVRGPKLYEENAADISSILEKYVPRAYVPQLRVIETDQYGIRGAIHFYLANITSNLTLINKKGV